jgi:predicted phosphodiesterase
VGDIVDGPEDAARCIELLRDHQVATVRGNHDRWLLAGNPLEPFHGPPWTLEWLAALPATRRFDTVAGPLLLGHGIGERDMAKLCPGDTGYQLEYQDELWGLVAGREIEIYVGGHTHERMARRFDHLFVLNPGTLAREDEPGFLELDLEAGLGRWYRVSLEGVTAEGELDLSRVPVEPGRGVAP